MQLRVLNRRCSTINNYRTTLWVTSLRQVRRWLAVPQHKTFSPMDESFRYMQNATTIKDLGTTSTSLAGQSHILPREVDWVRHWPTVTGGPSAIVYEFGRHNTATELQARDNVGKTRPAHWDGNCPSACTSQAHGQMQRMHAIRSPKPSSAAAQYHKENLPF